MGCEEGGQKSTDLAHYPIVPFVLLCVPQKREISRQLRNLQLLKKTPETKS
jgi:hypothetical protein